MSTRGLETCTSEVLGLQVPGLFQVKRNFDFHGRKIKNFVTFNGDYNSFTDFLRSKYTRNPSGSIDYNVSKFKQSIYDDSDISWKGGSFEDLIGHKVDMSAVEKATRELEKSKVWSRVSHAFSEGIARKRIKCEHDGDYDHDQRYDIKPYSSRSKATQIVRSIDLTVESGFSARISSETINKFGAFITALVNLLEKNGVQVGITACKTGQGFCAGRGGMFSDASDVYHTRLKVKEPNEYLPTGQIMRVLSSNWYRRAGFSLICMSAEVLKETVDDGLGQPFEFGTCWEIKGNKLNIYSVPDINEQESIVQKLLEIVNKKLGE